MNPKERHAGRLAACLTVCACCGSVATGQSILVVDDDAPPGGDASISMIPSGAVNAASCDGASWISVSVEYSLGGSSEDDNNNGIPDECEVLGDFDSDGDVDAADLILLLGAWGSCADCGDCDVDGSDLILLLGNWG